MLFRDNLIIRLFLVYRLKETLRFKVTLNSFQHLYFDGSL